MLLAPVLAVVLALLLAGALSIFPQNQPEPQAAHINFTPAPTPPSTVPPQPMPASVGDSFFLQASVICVFAIVIVALAVGLLFFREKNLKMD